MALERPDPDALLRKVQEEEVRANRAKLKIFFGAAPGVGKTYLGTRVAKHLSTYHLRSDILRKELMSVPVGVRISPGEGERSPS